MSVRVPGPSRPQTTVVHRAATWNLRKGRAARKVPNLLRSERLHWLVVEELNGRGLWLQKRLDRLHERDKMRHRYTVVAATDGDSAVIIRADVEWGAPRPHRMGGVQWERKPGRPGLHPERHGVSVRIGPSAGGYRVMPVHAPPQGGPAMPLRAKARERYRRRLEAILARWAERPNLSGAVAAGDQNENRRAAPIRLMLGRLGAKSTGNGVDWVIAVGDVAVSDYRRLERFLAASDHRARTFNVTTALPRR